MKTSGASGSGSKEK